PLELEVAVAERLDDRAEERELLAQQVRHRAALRLVVLGELVPVHGARVPGDGDAFRAVIREQLEEHVREAEQRVRREALGRRELLGQREERAVREVVPVDEEELGVARGPVVQLELGACEGLRHPRPGYRPAPMPELEIRPFSDEHVDAAAALLAAHALQWAHDEGYSAITIDWRVVNLLASRFFGARGFRPTFVRLYRPIP